MPYHLHREITKDGIGAFSRDGVVFLKGFFNPHRIEMLRRRADYVFANPGTLANELDKSSPDGRFFSNTYLCLQNDGF